MLNISIMSKRAERSCNGIVKIEWRWESIKAKMSYDKGSNIGATKTNQTNQTNIPNRRYKRTWAIGIKHQEEKLTKRLTTVPNIKWVSMINRNSVKNDRSATALTKPNQTEPNWNRRTENITCAIILPFGCARSHKHGTNHIQSEKVLRMSARMPIQFALSLSHSLLACQIHSMHKCAKQLIFRRPKCTRRNIFRFGIQQFFVSFFLCVHSHFSFIVVILTVFVTFFVCSCV